MLCRFPIAVALVVILCGLVHAEDWPMFGRNQTRNAVSPERNSPTWWQIARQDRDSKILVPSKNIRWSTQVNLGISYTGTYGDPVVLDGIVWIGSMGEKGDKKDAAALVCLD